MTPEAVIYKYLQITSGQITDLDELGLLLSADADLLARWLKLLQSPANMTGLLDHLAQLTQAELSAIAQAQAGNVMPFNGSARLSLDQWVAVLNAAFLGDILVEKLTQARLEKTSRPAQQEGLATPSGITIPTPLTNPSIRSSTRLRFLLALSGVHLAHDPELAKLVAYRGVKAELLEDAELEIRVFRVIDGLEFGQEYTLAEDLLQLDKVTLAQYHDEARTRTEAFLQQLQLDVSPEIDWSHRIWLRQQIQVATASMAGAAELSELMVMHQLVSACIFNYRPLFLYVDDKRDVLLCHGQASLVIKRTSNTSLAARAQRDQIPQQLSDTADLAVVDRELLKALGCEDALAIPICSQAGASRCILVVAEDEDLDLQTAAQLYAEQIAKHIDGLHEPSAEEQDQQAQDPEALALELFRTREIQRMREIVHEANNPLSIVHNYLHILELRLQHDASATEQLALIRGELTRAGQLFSSAREVPSAITVEEENKPEEPESIGPVDLGQWLSGVIELHTGMAIQNGIELIESEPRIDYEISTHAGKLNQIVGNLVKNAIEACAAGDQIQVGARKGLFRHGQPGIEIIIKDDGPGLPQDVLAALTKEKVSSKGGEHQGLGISVALRLAVELSGALDVVTQPQLGTRFSLFLPLEQD